MWRKKPKKKQEQTVEEVTEAQIRHLAEKKDSESCYQDIFELSNRARTRAWQIEENLKIATVKAFLYFDDPAEFEKQEEYRNDHGRPASGKFREGYEINFPGLRIISSGQIINREADSEVEKEMLIISSLCHLAYEHGPARRVLEHYQRYQALSEAAEEEEQEFFLPLIKEPKQLPPSRVLLFYQETITTIKRGLLKELILFGLGVCVISSIGTGALINIALIIREVFNPAQNTWQLISNYSFGISTLSGIIAGVIYLPITMINRHINQRWLAKHLPQS